MIQDSKDSWAVAGRMAAEKTGAAAAASGAGDAQTADCPTSRCRARCCCLSGSC